MSNAYVEFDQSSMLPLKISWNKTTDNLVEISKDFAIAFLTGKEKLTDYFIVEKNKVKSLVKKDKEYTAHKNFSILLSINDKIENFYIKILEHNIEIKLDELQHNYILYACLKNEPSWLLKTWNLGDELTDNGYIKIFFKNADNYSYLVKK
jgi:hypothetical protein